MNSRILVLLVALWITAGSAQGGFTYYSDQAAFGAAAGVTSLIDFNDLITPPASIVYFSPTKTISGVTFTANGALGAGGPGLNGSTALNFRQQNGDLATNTLTIFLAPNTTEFGFQYGVNDPIGLPRITFSFPRPCGQWPGSFRKMGQRSKIITDASCTNDKKLRLAFS